MAFDVLARMSNQVTELWTPSNASNALGFYSYSGSVTCDARGRISVQTDAPSQASPASTCRQGH